MSKKQFSKMNTEPTMSQQPLQKSKKRSAEPMKESQSSLKKNKVEHPKIPQTAQELLETLSQKLRNINGNGSLQNDIDSLLIEISERLKETPSDRVAVTEDSYLQYGVPKNNRDKIYAIRVSVDTGLDVPNTFRWSDVKLEDVATYTTGVKDGREWSSWRQNDNNKFVRGTFSWTEEVNVLDV